MPIYTIKPPIPYGTTMLLAAATLPDCGFSVGKDGIVAVDIPEEVAAQLDLLLIKDGYSLQRTDKEEL